MLKHLLVDSFGVSLGLKSQRIIIKSSGEIIKEYPLKCLKTISINSRGVSLSSDLAYACGARGIKIFFNGFKAHLALHTLHEHKGANVLINQAKASENGRDLALAKELIKGKIKNQRATILYFARYTQNEQLKINACAILKDLVAQIDKFRLDKSTLFGIEGSAARVYFDYIYQNSLLGASFDNRSGRYAQDNANKALNYGYAILQNVIHKSLLNAGLNPYLGVLHSIRSGKPSLVLDVMEEYRSFVVDRNIIKLRARLDGDFDSIKKLVVSEIFTSLNKRLVYNHSKLSLESIIQRQAYKLAGFLCGANSYKSYVFRW